MSHPPLPDEDIIDNIDLSDERNRRILSVAEDQLTGFHRHPFALIAERTGLSEEFVLARLRAMLAAGMLRRIRQTLLSTSLAEGALVAWQLPEEKLESAYAWLRDNDPFSGHIVLRHCEDAQAPGADYRLWTTLKVPIGIGTMKEHCALLMDIIGATDVVPLPVVGMFALAVGHVRRAGLKPGDKLPDLPHMQAPAQPTLDEQEWNVLLSLKESLLPEELCHDPWARRAAELGLSTEEFCARAQALDAKRVIGRFACFLDHQGRSSRHTGTGASGLFHWTVPEGCEERAGALCGQHICMTHCYWRSGGEAFGGAQIMGVVHSTSRERVLEHKVAIDAYLAEKNVPVLHTAVFWSDRSEVRPSELHPQIYREWWNKWSHK